MNSLPLILIVLAILIPSAFAETQQFERSAAALVIAIVAVFVGVLLFLK